MPVEIKELIIRAITIPDDDGAQGKDQPDSFPIDQEIMIQECVRQVLRILRKERER